MYPPYSPEKIVRSTFQHSDHPTGHNRFCQIFRDHWFRWWDLRMENEAPVDQRANITNIVQRMMLCRDPERGIEAGVLLIVTESLFGNLNRSLVFPY